MCFLPPRGQLLFRLGKFGRKVTILAHSGAQNHLQTDRLAQMEKWRNYYVDRVCQKWRMDFGWHV